jgi:hypothetical protein
MTKKLKIINISMLFLLLALFNMAMTPLQDATVTPTRTPRTTNAIKVAVTGTRTPRATHTATPTQTTVAAPTRARPTLSLEMQAGHTDGIAIIGIFIVAIIIIPIMLKYKEWRGN